MASDLLQLLLTLTLMYLQEAKQICVTGSMLAYGRAYMKLRTVRLLFNVPRVLAAK
jgi:hypothetical protein